MELSARERKAEQPQWRKTRKEAKKQYKMQMKAVKKSFKQQRKAWKQEKKAWEQTLRCGDQEHSHQDGDRHCWWEVQPSSADETWLLESGLAPAAEREAPPVQPAQSPLERLAEMGFENIELNAQLLEAHGGSLERVLQELVRLAADEDADMLK